jgi:hypothetical protein
LFSQSQVNIHCPIPARLSNRIYLELDEVGIAQSEDPKRKAGLVTKSMSGESMHHKVNRNFKHVSVIASVPAAGENLVPYIVTSQDSAPVQEQFKKDGVRLSTDFVLKARSNLYINGEILPE